MGPLRGADVHFCSPQPDTSLYRKTMDMGRVHRVCLSSQLKPVLVSDPREMEG